MCVWEVWLCELCVREVSCSLVVWAWEEEGRYLGSVSCVPTHQFFCVGGTIKVLASGPKRRRMCLTGPLLLSDLE